MKAPWWLVVLAACGQAPSEAPRAADIITPPAPGSLPNIILLMSDDQGYGDIGYQGNDVVRTPVLDRMSREGLCFSRFYAAPLCGPTRATCITGRHPDRFGIVDSNSARLPPGEHTLAELLRDRGYTTGHFGKWHLGTLTRTRPDSRRGGPRGAEYYSPPWENGFDVCFSTEAKVPTWDPMIMPRHSEATIWWDAVEDPSQAMPFHTDNEPAVAYWNERGEVVTDDLEGDDSRVIMDRVLPFVDAAAQAGRPFLAVVWFHAPHKPVVAGPEYAKLYADLEPFRKEYYGAITAMDEQIGRLREHLRAKGIERDTLVWFCSDNGPFGKESTHPGSTGGLRGRKGDLGEGGIRVPAILEWPGHVAARQTAVPASTLDFLPTLLELTGTAAPTDKELDGLSIVPLIEGTWDERPEPIPFESGPYLAYVDNRYKILSTDSGKSFALYDVGGGDPGERSDLSSSDSEHAAQTARYAERLLAWRDRVRADFRALLAGAKH